MYPGQFGSRASAVVGGSLGAAAAQLRLMRVIDARAAFMRAKAVAEFAVCCASDSSTPVRSHGEQPPIAGSVARIASAATAALAALPRMVNSDPLSQAGPKPAGLPSGLTIARGHAIRWKMVYAVAR